MTTQWDKPPLRPPLVDWRSGRGAARPNCDLSSQELEQMIDLILARISDFDDQDCLSELVEVLNAVEQRDVTPDSLFSQLRKLGLYEPFDGAARNLRSTLARRERARTTLVQDPESIDADQETFSSPQQVRQQSETLNSAVARILEDAQRAQRTMERIAARARIPDQIQLALHSKRRLWQGFDKQLGGQVSMLGGMSDVVQRTQMVMRQVVENSRILDLLPRIEGQTQAVRSALESLHEPMRVMERVVAQNTLTADLTAQYRAIDRLLRNNSLVDSIQARSRAMDRLVNSTKLLGPNF